MDEEPLLVKQNLRLCNWRNDPQDILSDTTFDLTVKLNKHTTIALVGCFRFRVLRGAININGANIEVLSRHGQKDQIYTVYTPAAYPISKIRGLDGVNQVQFTNCEDPTPLASLSPLFSDIWNSQPNAKGRSFSVVSSRFLYYALVAAGGIAMFPSPYCGCVLSFIAALQTDTDIVSRLPSQLLIRSVDL